MGLSREARIITLLVIDTVFFFVVRGYLIDTENKKLIKQEIIIGYWVGSLALVADSFHMLNDIISLIVALYAIKLATSPSTATNSYGWQRAEILGALINGVFLVALCVSIMLEAIKRFFSIEEVSNPMLVVIVGCLGLASNVVGLFLFHEHGHSHGGHSHSHGDEESHSHTHPAPPAIITTRPTDTETTTLLRNTTSPSVLGTSPSHARNESFSSLYGHPAQTRAAVIETAAEFGYGRHDHATSPSASSAGKRIALPEEAHTHDHAHGPEGSHSQSYGNGVASAATGAKADEKPEGANGHGHSHGNMNMRGVFLHVLGDALGNVGVIAAGLVIWFVKARWALYFDPAVSLFITVIIFTSALPLVKSASYILLQGVPSHVSLDAVHKSIMDVEGVVSVHELHVWQLSEKTVVASVHVLVAPGYDFMPVSNGIREVMHYHGIHSVTIQPENGPAEEVDDEQACLMRCPPELCAADTCCPPNGKLVDVEEEADGHSH